jgi:type III secretory pathway lipoprotein EscJ
LTGACGTKSLTSVASEQEAVEIITVLRESGVKVEKEEAGESSARRWNLHVAEADYDLANRLLRYHELPRPDEKAQEASPFQSESERRERQLKESKKQIEQHLRKLLGVARVSVLISPPDQEMRSNPAPAKADVTITHKDPQPTVTVDEIRQKVASSYPTLTPENISVRLQFDPVPSAPAREPGLDRRAYTIFAAGLTTVAVLTALLFFLLRKARRQRSPGAAADEPPAEGADGDGEKDLQMLARPTHTDAG